MQPDPVTAHNRKYSFVTVAHEADYNAMQLQARSMALYCPHDLVAEIIVIENFAKGSRFSWRGDLLKEYGVLSGLVRFVSAPEFGPVPSAEGWWSQQLFKLLVSTMVKSDIYIVLDAKNCLVSALSRDFLQDETGRAKLYSEGYRGHPLELYFNQVCDYFGIDREKHVDRFITTAPPFLMYTQQVRNLMEYISDREKRPFPEFFLHERKLTEFFLYGGYLVSADQLAGHYDLNTVQSPTIWAHSTSQGSVQQLIKQSRQGGAPFFGIHRTAYGRFDDATIALIADYWLEQKLFGHYKDSLAYLYDARNQQRHIVRRNLLLSLPRRVASKIKRILTGA